jgi:RIO-like serine/threonine protein kinase
MRKDHLALKESVYNAILYSHKTPSELMNELGMKEKTVENSLRFLLEHQLIRKRREGVDRPGVAFGYIACDSSAVHTFEEKLGFAKNGTPAIVGRCDFAASWVPRVSERIESEAA